MLRTAVPIGLCPVFHQSDDEIVVHMARIAMRHEACVEGFHRREFIPTIVSRPFILDGGVHVNPQPAPWSLRPEISAIALTRRLCLCGPRVSLSASLRLRVQSAYRRTLDAVVTAV